MSCAIVAACTWPPFFRQEVSMFRALVWLSCCWLIAVASMAAAQDKPVIKVGVIGLDNYQAVAFTELFHHPKAEGDLAGIKVVAAVPLGSPDIEESVQSLPKWIPAMEKLGV